MLRPSGVGSRHRRGANANRDLGLGPRPLTREADLPSELSAGANGSSVSVRTAARASGHKHQRIGDRRLARGERRIDGVRREGVDAGRLGGCDSEERRRSGVRRQRARESIGVSYPFPKKHMHRVRMIS